jgi:hypothetical protein
VTGSRQSIIVSRSYSPALDECARALELLLKKPIKKGGPTTAPDDAEGLKNARTATSIISKSP